MLVVPSTGTTQKLVPNAETNLTPRFEHSLLEDFNTTTRISTHSEKIVDNINFTYSKFKRPRRRVWKKRTKQRIGHFQKLLVDDHLE